MSVDATKRVPEELRRTPLHGLHLALGARMAPFAGYDMPLSYRMGVLAEHRHTRAAAGLFDISHMGQIVLHPKLCTLTDTADALERLVPADILALGPGRQRYTFFTNDRGGIVDDLMVANLGTRYFLVINAACKENDIALLHHHLDQKIEVERSDRGLIALQGPKAEAVLSRFAPECTEMRFMDVREIEFLGAECIVSRSGYTGEDGFEISIPSDFAREIAEGLLEDPDVAPIGLAARDTLRLEAGLCLYGADIDEATTPVMAGLSWAIPESRRRGGERMGGFPGSPIILYELEGGARSLRSGLAAEGRAPVRAGATLFASAEDSEPIGHVTSGGYGPSLDRPIAMGYVPSALSEPGTQLFAEVRGTRLPVVLTPLPFIEHRYRRS